MEDELVLRLRGVRAVPNRMKGRFRAFANVHDRRSACQRLRRRWLDALRRGPYLHTYPDSSRAMRSAPPRAPSPHSSTNPVPGIDPPVTSCHAGGPVIRRVVRTMAYALAIGCAAAPLAAQAGSCEGSVADSSGITARQRLHHGRGHRPADHQRNPGHLRGQRRARRPADRPSSPHRLSRPPAPRSPCRPATSSPGLRSRPEHGGARADQCRHRIARATHRRRGAGGAGGHLPGGGAPRSREAPRRASSCQSVVPLDQLSRARASPTRATSSGRSPSAG